MSRSGRVALAGVLTTLACVAMPVTLASEYAARVLESPSGFSSRAVTVVQTGSVDSLIVGAVTNRIVAYSDRVLAISGGPNRIQPLVADAVRAALASPELIAAVRTAAASLQRALTFGSAGVLTLTLPRVGAAVAATVAATSPALAAQLRSLGPITVVSVPIPPLAARFAHDLEGIARSSSLLLALTVTLIVSALLISPRRARTLRALGLGAVLCGVLAAGVYLIGRELAVSSFSAADARAVAGVVWRTYFGGLETWGLVAAGVGAGVTGVGVILGVAAGARPGGPSARVCSWER